jgi:hypothetical protein
MENVKSWHQSSRRVGSTQNREQMMVPFWEPIPYKAYLTHCEKLRAQPPKNLLKPINSKIDFIKKNWSISLCLCLISFDFPCYHPFFLNLFLFLCLCFCLFHTHTHIPVYFLLDYTVYIHLFLMHLIRYICLPNLSIIVSWELKHLPT